VRKWRWGVALLARGGPDDRAEAEACLTGARAWLEESGAAGYAGRVAELGARLAGRPLVRPSELSLRDAFALDCAHRHVVRVSAIGSPGARVRSG
jgi:hypothetical protein